MDTTDYNKGNVRTRRGTRLHFRLLGGAVALLLTLWGCASIGSPSGGPRDEDPPRFVKANPAPGSVNVDPSDISIEFNELINVKDAFEKVVLSPPGAAAPRVSTRGRRVLVSITDTLLPNTTYTIDFGDAIEDNNEANKLSGFAYTFSTGPTLDSLRISGMVLGAEDLEPQQGVFVGAYISREDSAFLKMPFHRLARTDEYGRFVIRGLQDTVYYLFALKDLDNDKHFANPEEDIAWYGEPIRPYAERIMAHDTIRDLYTGEVDTIINRERTRYLPNNILLRMYNTRVRPQYLVSYTRPDSTRLQFILNATSRIAPSLSFVGEDDFAAPLTPEKSIGNDTLTYWLPKSLAARDTLQVALRYQRIDIATGLETMANDTLKLLKPKDKSKGKDDKKKKKKRKTETSAVPNDSVSADGIPLVEGENGDVEEEPKPKAPTFSFTVTASQTDVNAPMRIEVPVPLEYLDTLAFRLEQNPDSVWSPVRKEYRLQRADTLSERRFMLEYPWERGMTYRLTADSLAARDIYGVESAKLEYELKMKPADELSNLKLTLTGLDPSIPAFAQLIVSGDKPKYTEKISNGVADFQGIESGKYYVRVYEDFNGDREYTPGVYRMQRVFGTPALSTVDDSVSTAAVDTLNPVAETVVLGSDTMENVTDSVAGALKDSIGVSVDVESKDIPILTNEDAIARLIRMGYSLAPLETDSVGTDILIAIQPDLAYYMPKTINVKKNWDVEQTWNVFETPLDLQKPSKLKKNKPKRTGNQRQQTDEEEEEEDEDFGGNPFDPNRRRTGNNANGMRNNMGGAGFRQNTGF